jgi:cell division protein FtsW
MNSIAFSRTDQSHLSEWWWTISKSLLIAILALSVIGVALVASASPSVADRINIESYNFLKKHLVFLFIALSGMITLTFFKDERWIWRISLAAFLCALIATLMTLFSNFEVKGATRWLVIMGFNLQPSEILKPALLVVNAWLFTKAREKAGKEARIFHVIAWGNIILCMGLLMAQPDMGMTFLLGVSFGVQLFLNGMSLRYIAILAPVLIGLFVIVYFTHDHFYNRVNDFLYPESGDTYQVDLSLNAFANGGLVGTGLGQGTVKNQIPDVHADFIFSAAGEELGFIPTLLFIGLFAFIIAHGLRLAMRSESLFCMLACGPLLSMIALQSMIHMGSAMTLIPAKGMTLPFVSYGGSSMIGLGFTFGIIIALTRGYKSKNSQI